MWVSCTVQSQTLPLIVSGGPFIAHAIMLRCYNRVLQQLYSKLSFGTRLEARHGGGLRGSLLLIGQEWLSTLPLCPAEKQPCFLGGSCSYMGGRACAAKNAS